jgi:type VI secretion system protein ImpF
MKGFTPGLLDRLMDERTRRAARLRPRMSIEQLKDSVARDLEACSTPAVALPPALRTNSRWRAPRS